MKKIISGVVCMTFAMSCTAMPGSLVTDAVNLETVATVNATDPGTLENGLAYETYEDHVEITGCATSAEGEIIIPDTIQGLPVTSISVFAFDNCTFLTSVIIPDSVTEIGWSAFNFCVALQSVTIPDGVTSIGTLTFSGCKSLESVTIPDSVISIGESAFSDCYALKSITIPDSVTEIWWGAFKNCSSLTAIQVDPENQNYMDIDGVLFSKDQTELSCYPAGKSDQAYTIPESVTNILDCAFYGCSSLTSVTIPDRVTSIGNSAFYSCQSLEAVTIPDGVKDMKDNTFSRCFSLQSVTISDSVTRIGLKAFWDCSALESVTIPDSVTRIDDDAFQGCSALTSITIPGSVTSIGSRAFFSCSSLEEIHVDPENQNYKDIDGILFSKDQKILLQYPQEKSDSSYSVPDGVTSIEERAFSDCSALRSVTIPDSVTNIGNYAFFNCKIREITIPAHVTNIDLCAFYCCFSLESAKILNPDCEIDDNKKTISDTAVIYGYPGSTAQAYAEKYNREFVALDENPVNSEILWGDANHDGNVDISDVVLMNRVYVGVDQISAEGMKNADVDQSGKIELSDSMNVLKLLVHLLEQSDFPIGQ